MKSEKQKILSSLLEEQFVKMRVILFEVQLNCQNHKCPGSEGFIVLTDETNRY